MSAGRGARNQSLDAVEARARAAGLATARVRDGHGVQVGGILGDSVIYLYDDRDVIQGATQRLNDPTAISPGALILTAIETERMRRVVLAEPEEQAMNTHSIAVLADRLRELGVPEWRVRCVVALLGGAP